LEKFRTVAGLVSLLSINPGEECDIFVFFGKIQKRS